MAQAGHSCLLHGFYLDLHNPSEPKEAQFFTFLILGSILSVIFLIRG